jgi:hypothetical protein
MHTVPRAVACRWAGHLARTPAADDEDSGALVTWPSRDVTAATTLLRHGFTPMAVIAARSTRTAPSAPTQPATQPSTQPATQPAAGPAPAGVRIRRATPADAGEVARLGAETVRCDSCFGGITERPWTAGALREEMAGFLAAPEPWVWLAERDGAGIGMLAAEPPDVAECIAPTVGRALVALLLLGVSAGERGSGVGAALTARFRRQIETAGGRGHPAALRAGQPVVRAVLAEAGLPAAVDRVGDQARPRYPLISASRRPLYHF